ncbi:MAG: histidine kinase N-terminal 7TM domain-containing protein, partial [Chloroflexota bacterium]|nr:histidine kinase N-terminal 7TM domain-containing protein [Chloroflexota bacterium]
MSITTYYAIALSVSAVVSLAIAFWIWSRRSVPGGMYFSLMMLAVSEWAIAATFEAISVETTMKILWSQISYVGITSAPLFFFLFALNYWRPDIRLRLLYQVLIWIIPVVTIIMAATNEIHGLLWNSFTPGPEGTNALVYGHGTWFWIHVVYSYSLMLASVALLVRALLSFPYIYRRQSFVVLIAAMLPWVANVVYVAGFSPLPGLDPAPMAFSVTGFVLALGIVKFQLLNIVPVARELLLQRMDSGVMVVDNQGRIVDVNPAAECLVGRKIK